MIDAPLLLKDLRKLLRTLETDIRGRVAGSAAEEPLKAEWQASRDAGRTAQPFTTWLDDEVTQAAVHWVLGCVFLRFVEDNQLVGRPWLSGPGERLELARERHEAWFRANPTGEERDFVLACFAEAAELPGLGALFDRRHNPLWRLPVSGDGAIALREFWWKRNPDTGVLAHDFTDGSLGTRFLGDLYQDLSESARKRYALLQTPEFVEEFILDRTLEPAIREFGFREVRLIDPTCGSGHFLLGAFHRLFDLWTRNEPARNPRDCAQKALDAVSGVDINPFAVAVARFRLLVAALKVCELSSLPGAPDFHFEIATGDSLLHGKRFMETRGVQLTLDQSEGVTHYYHTEDRDDLDRILGRQYHAVVGNPPYITVKDKALNDAYRQRYGTCHMLYSLGVPFTERFFDLARCPENDDISAGFVGMITANSFMKREFGKRLIEAFLPRIDLTHVVNADGARIPGHGTPTVMLFGRNRRPKEPKVRVVMSIRGEPGTPDDPSQGKVWASILDYMDRPGSQNEFVSVDDSPRTSLASHPWSMGGGGASELKVVIGSGHRTLSSYIEHVGRTTVVGEDDVFIYGRDKARRCNLLNSSTPLIIGEVVRDWACHSSPLCYYPYSSIGGIPIHLEDICHISHLWPYRRLLENRSVFGKTLSEKGSPWFAHLEHYTDKLKTPLAISFAFVATHNHFVLDCGGKLFNRSAPVIKLPADKTENDYFFLLGPLNSSTGCFWMKQVFYPKSGSGMGRGVQDEQWENRFEFDGTKIALFPLPGDTRVGSVSDLGALAHVLTGTLPDAILKRAAATRGDLDAARTQAFSIRRRMIALQEELDWRCYRLYDLLEEDVECSAPPEIDLGERAFEIVMARKMAEGELETAWFARHGSTPITEIPDHWPAGYRALVERRIALIEDHRWINLVERPEYKRRWQWDENGFEAGWVKREKAALKDWLLDRLEDPRYWSGDPALTSVSRLSDLARRDTGFLAVAELYVGRPDFELQPLVAELVAAEAVPFLPVLRYSEDGLRKRRAWEETWELQRREDAIDARAELPEGHPQRLSPAEAKALKAAEVGDIPVPPKYKNTPPDFQKSDFWRLRGGLDVPKERFISYPFAERDADGSPIIAWAGYDHLQQATALAGAYLAMKETEGWPVERLTPLLAGVQELVPWLLQWHNDYNPEYGVGLGDYYRSFVADEARALGLSLDDLRNWTPPARTATRRGRKTKTEASA
jgi:hypothetical protein